MAAGSFVATVSSCRFTSILRTLLRAILVVIDGFPKASKNYEGRSLGSRGQMRVVSILICMLPEMDELSLSARRI